MELGDGVLWILIADKTQRIQDFEARQSGQWPLKATI